MHRHLGGHQSAVVIATYFRRRSPRPARIWLRIVRARTSDALNWQVHNRPPQSSPTIAVGCADVWADNYERALIRDGRYQHKAVPAMSRWTHRDDDTPNGSESTRLSTECVSHSWLIFFFNRSCDRFTRAIEIVFWERKKREEETDIFAKRGPQDKCACFERTWQGWSNEPFRLIIAV